MTELIELLQETAGRTGLRCRHARRLAALDRRMVPQPQRRQAEHDPLSGRGAGVERRHRRPGPDDDADASRRSPAIIAAGEVKLLAIDFDRRGCRTIPTFRPCRKPFRASRRRAGPSWSRRRARPPRSCKRSTPTCAPCWRAPSSSGRFEELGNYTRPMTPQELADFVRDERDIMAADRQADRHAAQ